MPIRHRRSAARIRLSRRRSAVVLTTNFRRITPFASSTSITGTANLLPDDADLAGQLVEVMAAFCGHTVERDPAAGDKAHDPPLGVEVGADDLLSGLGQAVDGG